MKTLLGTMMIVMACSGCATKMLQNNVAKNLERQGYYRLGNGEMGRVETKENSLGAQGYIAESVNLGEAAQAEYGWKYNLAWVLDYIGLPVAAGTAGYAAVNAVNGGSSDEGDNNSATGGRDTYRTGDNSKIEIHNYPTTAVTP